MAELNPVPINAVQAGPARHTPPASPREAAMRHVAREFEAIFLAEMLKHAGVGRMTDGFNGGAGEAAFSGMLTQEYAREITRSGGFGLAERVLEAMRESER